MRERGQWEAYLLAEQARHHALMRQIIRLETALNDVVCDAFSLDAAERRLIEEATKYPYGEP